MGHLTSAAHTARPYRFRWNDCNYQSLSNRNPLTFLSFFQELFSEMDNYFASKNQVSVVLYTDKKEN
jgi:hypothetical protein